GRARAGAKNRRGARRRSDSPRRSELRSVSVFSALHLSSLPAAGVAEWKTQGTQNPPPLAGVRVRLPPPAPLPPISTGVSSPTTLRRSTVFAHALYSSGRERSLSPDESHFRSPAGLPPDARGSRRDEGAHRILRLYVHADRKARRAVLLHAMA